MTNHDRFEYDVAVSFAAEDRALAEDLMDRLRAKGFRVWTDEYAPPAAQPDNIVAHLAELYRTKAWYCLMLISHAYPLQRWTDAERTDAQAHALRDASEYLVPIRVDDADVPGVTEATGSHDLRQEPLEKIVDWLEAKLKEKRERSGPPSKSHDLRSGNVPSA
jgi:hypothetical protein